jgi:hypothetical protein
MHQPPEKLEKGWAIHQKAYNDLLEYVIKTRPIPTHGHTETEKGTMPPPIRNEEGLQFTPTVTQGDSPTLSIGLGYVFASFRDTSLTADAHLPQIQQHAFEPKINSSSGDLLSADPMPSIALTKNSPNYISLVIEWTANKFPIGGHTYESKYAFESDYNLDADDNDVVDAAMSDAPPPPGIHTQIDKVFYTHKHSYFIKDVNQQPSAETELITRIPSGLINLDKNGKIIDETNREGLIWFLQGPIFANRPPNYESGKSSPDREEPIEPIQPDNYIYPGAELDT